MAAPIVVVDAEHPDAAVVARAASLIREGQLVVVPTETVYGLAANALDPAAVARIFAVKGRPSYNPLIVHLADVAGMHRVVRTVPALAEQLAAAFWPGPLSLVMQRQPVVPDIVTGGRDTVAVRIPASAATRAVIRAAGVPLAAPSANLSERVSPTTAQHVASQLGDGVALILDTGPTRVGIESTVLDLTTSPPRLLRPGGITRQALESVIGPLGPALVAREGEALPSPGMMARHYAPSATLRLVEPAQRESTLAAAAALRDAGQRVTIVVRGTAALPFPDVRTMPHDAAGYARELYAMLHALDAEKINVAFVERVPAGSAWDAIRDRLTRAATPP